MISAIQVICLTNIRTRILCGTFVWFQFWQIMTQLVLLGNKYTVSGRGAIT